MLLKRRAYDQNIIRKHKYILLGNSLNDHIHRHWNAVGSQIKTQISKLIIFLEVENA